jgi:hypothetical protein
MRTTLTRDQWAWEFLRRNPAYRADYAEFITLWRALEADYGAPPERDFQRWKLDPRAYGPLPGQADADAGDNCIGDDDRVLLECWLGAKWGFNKFPLDPARSAPPTADELSWRPLPAKPADAIDPVFRLDIAFDLALPLSPQLDAARSKLAARVAALRREHIAAPLTAANQRDYWARLLTAFDAPATATESDLVEARNRVAGGYLDITRLSE